MTENSGKRSLLEFLCNLISLWCWLTGICNSWLSRFILSRWSGITTDENLVVSFFPVCVAEDETVYIGMRFKLQEDENKRLIKFQNSCYHYILYWIRMNIHKLTYHSGGWYKKLLQLPSCDRTCVRDICEKENQIWVSKFTSAFHTSANSVFHFPC